MENFLLWISNMAQDAFELLAAWASVTMAMTETVLDGAVARAEILSFKDWAAFSLPLVLLAILVIFRQGRRISKLERQAGVRAVSDIRSEIDHLESVLAAHHQELDALKSHFVQLRLERQGNGNKAKVW